jgi:hypothetical protein
MDVVDVGKGLNEIQLGTAAFPGKVKTKALAQKNCVFFNIRILLIFNERRCLKYLEGDWPAVPQVTFLPQRLMS